MKKALKALFCDNLELDSEIAAFLAQDPEFVQAKRDLDETAQEIAQIAGFQRYDHFEDCFIRYAARLSELHYLFGLALRQEVLQAMGAKG